MQMAASHCQATQLMVIEQETIHGRCMMMRFENAMRAAATGRGVVLLDRSAPPSSRTGAEKQTDDVQTSKRHRR